MLHLISVLIFCGGSLFYIAGGIFSELGYSTNTSSSIWIGGGVLFFLGSLLGFIKTVRR